MAVPGVSAIEILIIIRKCKDIYEGLRNEFAGASEQVLMLVDTCEYLETVLLDVHSIVGDGYPKLAGISRTLEQCATFIDKYKSLSRLGHRQEHHNSKITSSLSCRDKWRLLGETVRLEFDNRAQLLKESLSLEMQKLTIYLVIYLMSVARTLQHWLICTLR
jgi:hypothetical protein